MAPLCRGYNVNDFFISALICRRNKFLNEKVNRINFSQTMVILKREIYKMLQICQNQESQLRNLYIFQISFINYLLTKIFEILSHTKILILHTLIYQVRRISTKCVLYTHTSKGANIENNVLRNLGLKNLAKAVIGQINISFLRNKFVQ